MPCSHLFSFFYLVFSHIHSPRSPPPLPPHLFFPVSLTLFVSSILHLLVLEQHVGSVACHPQRPRPPCHPATLARGEAVASVVWLQVFLSDVLENGVSRRDWIKNLSPFSVGISEDSRLAKGQSQCHVVDAKAVFDTLQTEAAGSKQDRRAAIDLAIIQPG